METTFQKISRKSGRKPVECKCTICKSQCQKQVCLGTPEDIVKLVNAGYSDRLMRTMWGAGVMMGLVKEPVEIVAPYYDRAKGSCTFFTNGLCELHDLGLKPTEGKLSHHSTDVDNFNAKKSLSWLVVKEWLALTADKAWYLINKINDNEHMQ